MRKTHDIRTLNISNLKCPVCQNTVPIPRPYNARSKGHKKWFYCPYCKRKRNMLKIRSCDFVEKERFEEDNGKSM